MAISAQARDELRWAADFGSFFRPIRVALRLGADDIQPFTRVPVQWDIENADGHVACLTYGSRRIDDIRDPRGQHFIDVGTQPINVRITVSGVEEELTITPRIDAPSITVQLPRTALCNGQFTVKWAIQRSMSQRVVATVYPKNGEPIVEYEAECRATNEGLVIPLANRFECGSRVEFELQANGKYAEHTEKAIAIQRAEVLIVAPRVITQIVVSGAYIGQKARASWAIEGASQVFLIALDRGTAWLVPSNSYIEVEAEMDVERFELRAIAFDEKVHVTAFEIVAVTATLDDDDPQLNDLFSH